GAGGGPTRRRNLRLREGSVDLRGAGRDTAGLTAADVSAPAATPAVAADLPARSTDGADPLPGGARRAAVPDRGARPRGPACSPPPRPEAPQLRRPSRSRGSPPRALDHACLQPRALGRAGEPDGHPGQPAGDRSDRPRPALSGGRGRGG